MPEFPAIDFFLMCTEALKWLSIAASSIFTIGVTFLAAMGGLRAFSRFLSWR